MSRKASAAPTLRASAPILLKYMALCFLVSCACAFDDDARDKAMAMRARNKRAGHRTSSREITLEILVSQPLKL